MDGLSLRSLGLRLEKTHKQIDNIVRKELNELITCEYLSQQYCDPKKWSGICCIDGTYISVGGYENKIPFIYCVDYLTHDVICGFLFTSESSDAYMKIMRTLKDVGYPLKTVVCDDVLEKLGFAMKYHYPRARIQLCIKHYTDNLKQNLNYYRDMTHHDFITQVVTYLRFRGSAKPDEFLILFGEHESNPLYREALLNLKGKEQYLLHYLSSKSIPRDNNLIELYNSQLKGRLKTIKGFTSYTSASRFLNAWMVRRRTKAFTDCSKRFCYLNGKQALECVLNDTVSLEEIQEIVYGK